MNREKLVVAAVVSLVAYTLALSLFNSAFSSPNKNDKLSSRGAIKAHTPLMVYSDAGTTSKLSSIDWGLLEPGDNKNLTSYIKNNDKSPLKLSLATENWNPSNALQYITLSWDYNGQSVNPGEVVKVTFTLVVSTNVSGIADFSFDIIIVGTS